MVESEEYVDCGNYSIIGATDEMITAAVSEYNPDIIGITVPATIQASCAVNTARICRQVSPESIIVFGGADASVSYSRHLSSGVCDYCIIGEGECTFRKLVTHFDELKTDIIIKGAACIRNGKVVYEKNEYIQDLDELCYPAYDLVNMETYFKSEHLYQNRSHLNERSISIITGRGCPYGCIFCTAHQIMGRVYRPHSAEYVFNHIKHLKKQYGITHFHIEDGNISLNRERFVKLLDILIDSGINIQWDVPDGLRADSIDESIIKKMKKAGCVEFNIAIESGDQEVLDRIIKKHLDLNKVLEVARICNEIGLQVNAFYMIGLPGEKIAQIKKTVNLALELYKKYHVTPYLFYATPMYNTELYRICVEEKIIDPILNEDEMAAATYLWGTPMIHTADFTKADLKRISLFFLLEMNKLGFHDYSN